MKTNLLKTLIKMSKYAIYSVVVQSILCSFAFSRNSEAQAKKLSEIDLKVSFYNVSLEEAFKKIEHSTEFSFAYLLGDLPEGKITLSKRKRTFEEVLLSISEQTGVSFRRVDKTIHVKISNDNQTRIEEVIQAPLQNISVTGKVISDENPDGLPGVNVIIKNTSQGTVTDINGNYQIDVPAEESVLVFSSVGYITEEITAGTQAVINVTMMPDITSLEEIVVIGYGAIKKRDLTGAVGSVSKEDITAISPSTFSQSLQGRISGVQVTSISGRPGADVSVRVRGVGTINNNDPLYIVDGTPIYGALSSINPADIESIEVLKDASSTAIYGTRGANGVIIITTKRGEEGKAKFSYDAYTGIQTPVNKLEMLNAEEYALYTNEMRSSQKIAPLTPEWAYPENIPGGIDTDWQDEVLRNAFVQNHNLTVSGGGNGTLYNISGNYLDQDGIIKNSDFRRYSIRANTDSKISDRIKLGSSMMYAYTIEGLVGSGEILTQAINQLPTIPVKFEDGSWGGPPGIKEFYNDNKNPVTALSLNENNRYRNRFLGNAFVEITLLDGLVLKPIYSTDFSIVKNKSFSPSYTTGAVVKPSIDLAESFARSLIQTFETSLSYDKTVNQKHQISAVAVFSTQQERYESESMSTNNLLSANLPYFDAAAGDLKLAGNATEWSLLSYTGRVNYTFNDKYLLSGTVRRDGSSRFGANNRWAVFPAFSVGWRLSQESFIDFPDFVDELKLRGSWGTSGNQEIGLYSFVENLDNKRSYVLGSSQHVVPGVSPTSLPNPNLKWEMTDQTNIGLDANLFKNSLSFSVNYYIKNTKDMIVRVPIPRFSGISTAPYVNAGSMENKGWEFDISYGGSFSEFKYSLNGNVSFNKNKLTSLGTGNEIISGTFSPDGTQVGGKNVTITRPGDPVGSFYGHITDGIFQNQQEIESHATQLASTAPGDIRFLDIYEDDKIDGEDRTIIGNPWPDAIFGFNATAEYKGFDFSVFLQGTSGNDIYNGVRSIYAISNTDHNYLKEVLDRWRGEGTNTENPRAVLRDVAENSRVSDRWVEDGSYVRLKNISLGYTLPNSFVDRFKIDRLRFYLSGTNVFTLTNYKGIDPEVGSSSDLATGIDYNIYPVSRTITLGINLTF